MSFSLVWFIVSREYPEIRWLESEFQFQRDEDDFFFLNYIVLDEYFKYVNWISFLKMVQQLCVC